jgi:hypothetical protein
MKSFFDGLERNFHFVYDCHFLKHMTGIDRCQKKKPYLRMAPLDCWGGLKKEKGILKCPIGQIPLNNMPSKYIEKNLLELYMLFFEATN